MSRARQDWTAVVLEATVPHLIQYDISQKYIVLVQVIVRRFLLLVPTLRPSLLLVVVSDGCTILYLLANMTLNLQTCSKHATECDATCCDVRNSEEQGQQMTYFLSFQQHTSQI